MTHPNHLAADLLAAVIPERALKTTGTTETPARMVKALKELTSGYEVDLVALMKQFPAESSDLVVVRDMRYASLCEHHVLPFTGTVSVAYIPSKTIVGLSKIPRVVRALSRRLQVQERLTAQIADAFEPLKPLGVAVLVRGRHTCCALRGIEAEAEMVTSVVRGVFKSDASARAEVMRLL